MRRGSSSFDFVQLGVANPATGDAKKYFALVCFWLWGLLK
jgi:hypothetical protein